MVDILTPAARSERMALIRGKNTKPEWLVRRMLHRLGYRFRTHFRGLPGTPDIVFTRRKAAIFVHGCFWHSHDCRRGRVPKSRQDYWDPKIQGNKARDARHKEALQEAGWRVLEVWECHTLEWPDERLSEILTDFLGAPKTPPGT